MYQSNTIDADEIHKHMYVDESRQNNIESNSSIEQSIEKEREREKNK